MNIWDISKLLKCFMIISFQLPLRNFCREQFFPFSLCGIYFAFLFLLPSKDSPSFLVAFLTYNVFYGFLMNKKTRRNVFLSNAELILICIFNIIIKCENTKRYIFFFISESNVLQTRRSNKDLRCTRKRDSPSYSWNKSWPDKINKKQPLAHREPIQSKDHLL